MADKSNMSWMQRFMTQIVKQGEVPRHVAVIMDGNRRYAKSKGLPTIEGHRQGYKKMMEAQEWCREMGVYALTAYAFSIENFKRPKEEVDGLMALFEEAFQEVLDNIETPIKRGVQIRVMGRLELFPQKLQTLAGQIMDKTAHCTKHVLNMACPYTSRDDMTSAIHHLMDGVGNGLIQPEDVSEGLMEKCLQTRDLPPVDMIIRTSGEMRFSDFMLWQSSYSYICFEKVTWPEYGFWNFIWSGLLYQRHAHHLKENLIKAEKELQREKSDGGKGSRIKNFLQTIDRNYVQYVKQLSNEQCVRRETLRGAGQQ